MFVILKICKHLHLPLFMLCLKNPGSEVLNSVIMDFDFPSSVRLMFKLDTIVEMFC